MRFLANTNFPFMRYKWAFIGTSLVLLAVSLFSIFFGRGLVMGVDFAGGTQLTLRFKDTPDIPRVRRALEGLQLGEVTIQRFDEEGLNEILVRMQNPEAEGDFTKAMLDALEREFDVPGAAVHLNRDGAEAVRDALVHADPDAVGGAVERRREHYQPMAEALLAYRKEAGLLKGPADLERIAALSPGVRRYFANDAFFGQFAMLAADNVGPLVGKDLRNKATLAVVFSLAGMLVYIWFRFQLPYGIGALAALFHDVIITLGALSLTQREMNLPTIAALLTLVGYSVNDTVVIFDRIRERLKLERGMPLPALMDKAINQTLSRTVITSGLTLLVVAALFLFGGDVINTFAFVLLVGIVVGTYSSIYIASPVALALTQFLERRREARRRRR